jgi:hypothetical protein
MLDNIKMGNKQCESKTILLDNIKMGILRKQDGRAGQFYLILLKWGLKKKDGRAR